MTKEIAISDFKAHCLEIVNKLQNNNEPIIITKRNKPVAKIEAVDPKPKTSLFGILSEKAQIKEDIISPINEKWDCENE